MTIYLASHQQTGHELFSHPADARRWVEAQADYHKQTIGQWITSPEEYSLRLADGQTYVGTVRHMVVDRRAEHRQYEAEQQAAARAAVAAEADATADRVRDAAQRALAALDDLIANTTDPGTEALGARDELATALTTP